ncbi:MAG: VOC family protein [Gammaproteobacteria bacterium]|nr:VOC family protein [Gammaproteobacteria bacterium]
MFTLNSFVLYVQDIARSKKFYSQILECEIQELSPSFLSIPLGDSTITLKQFDQVSPPANTTGGGTELSLLTKDADALNQLFKRWKTMGVKIIQEPIEQIFGQTFVAADPDGHRIRLFSTPEQ